MEAAVRPGFSRRSGDISPRGNLNAERDERLTELARRGGATPLAECSEFREALRSRVGVAERESRPFSSGLRGAPRLLATLGDRCMEGLKPELGLGEDVGDLAGEDVASESCFRESDR